MPTIENYRGIIPAIACPFTASYQIDEPALRKHASWLATQPGVVAVMTNGHTGEVFSLTARERAEVTRIVADEVKGRVPVVSGIADPDVRRRMVDEFGGLPFYEATAETLEVRLGALILDRGLQVEWGTRGRLHVERFHSEQAVVERAIALYEQPVAVAA